ncbi:hypothetical protein LEP1GSC202_3094 [Leptospira yanagawae serovar Saopaulo str. Sao Paulo = ATCC 700523]|uniref:Uncharacterized protein n=1 Tax=Leptospira yanagawae serovar Saopaulo str. Sao Paulo = ATCC 700523 TaxID=1249483 RepID=A0A5E8HA33_9LEPT|nr:hypothetical protein [Leptospira yanagawae]EOQ88069.1 hypothetical protein LEP1GSC202_3094 [Leptospira yanagawae serovar Saopaulo str. Sao Paulo = ATCC 700523]
MIFKSKWVGVIFLFSLSTFPFSSIFAQISGFDVTYPSAYLLGLSSQGVVSNNQMGSLYGNTAFLSYQSKHILDVSVNGSHANGKISPLYLSGAGYYSFSESLGFGLRGKPVYLRSFPSDERYSNYAFQTFANWKLNPYISFGLQIGPSVSGRLGGYSSYSWNVSISTAIQYENFRFGFLFESPGKYRFDEYLGSERLKEKLPERALVGFGYLWSDWIFLQLELSRKFYEQTSVSLNNSNQYIAYPIRTMYSGNVSLAIGKPEGFQFLTGVGKEIRMETELRGFYTASLGVAGSLFPNWFGEGYLYAVSIQRSGISVPEREGAETRMAAQLQVQF